MDTAKKTRSWRVFYRLSNGEVWEHGLDYETEMSAQIAADKVIWGGLSAWVKQVDGDG